MESQITKTTSNTRKMIDWVKRIISPTSLPSKTIIDGKIRNVLLVGAALIATVTFQAGISPPGGVWQDDDDSKNMEGGHKDGHKAGRAIYSDQIVAFHIFLICNTMALTSSTFLLLCLTFGCPYFLEVLIAAVSMIGTYSSGIQCIAPDESVSFRLLFIAALAPIVIRCVIWACSTAPSTEVMVKSERVLSMPSQNTETTSIMRKMINHVTHIISPTSPTSETDGEIRNFMLVGAALIATVTFQAGITPPGGVWQDSKGGHIAGQAVYSDRGVPFLIFLIWNTIALTASTFLLLCLTCDYPYFLEVLIAVISMMGTYSSGIYCITPNKSVSFRLLFVVVTAPIVIRFLIWVAFAARRKRMRPST